MKSIKDFQGRVQNIETLGLEKDELVKDLLKKACKHVEKVMKRRNWTVTLVKEFIPKDTNLVGLNENAGETIFIRVRKSQDLLKFYPYEHVVGTLLHELVHIEHGPHAGPFYKLLDQITEECENDPMASDSSSLINSVGYKSSCHRHNPDESDRRRLALLAAEKRKNHSTLMLPKTGRRLGGIKDLAELTPREATALATINRFSTN